MVLDTLYEVDFTQIISYTVYMLRLSAPAAIKIIDKIRYAPDEAFSLKDVSLRGDYYVGATMTLLFNEKLIITLKMSADGYTETLWAFNHKTIADHGTDKPYRESYCDEKGTWDDELLLGIFPYIVIMFFKNRRIGGVPIKTLLRDRVDSKTVENVIELELKNL